MYLFYENHVDADGVVLTTDCICSSFQSGIGVNWRADGDMMEAVVKLFKTAVPLESRIYNPKTFIWTFIGGAGARILTIITAAYAAKKSVTFVEVEDLQGQLAAGGIKPVSKLDPKKFFYNHAIVSKPALTREKAKELIAPLLLTTPEAMDGLDAKEVKKLYRAAAMRLHPDRNNGDGSQMSELNMLWSVYV